LTYNERACLADDTRAMFSVKGNAEDEDTDVVNPVYHKDIGMSR